MTVDEIVERGIVAESILHDRAILSFVEELAELTKQALVNTIPAHHKEREALYYRYKAIEDLYGILNQYVIQKEQIASNTDQDMEAD